MASVLMLHLKKQGWLQKGNPGKELNVVMDNCGGQNKNNHVIRLALPLVELGYFKSVNFIFHMVGHTKNMCDGFFNTLKRKCRRSNIFSMEGLVNLFDGAHEKVSVHLVEKSDFKDWSCLLNQCYETIQGGMIKKNHIFSVHEVGKMEIRVDNIGTEEPFVQSAMDNKNGRGRQEILGSVETFDTPQDHLDWLHLKILKAHRISERKQIELGVK